MGNRGIYFEIQKNDCCAITMFMFFNCNGFAVDMALLDMSYWKGGDY